MSAVRRSDAGQTLRARLLAGPYPAWLQQSVRLMRRAVSEFMDDHCPQYAAAMSYHVLFSLFPLAIAAVGIIGLITEAPTAREEVATAVLKFVPLSSHGSTQLQDLLKSVSGSVGGLGLLGLVGVIWSASGVMASVRTALNVAWDTTAKRPFVRGKVVDLLLVAGVFVAIAATLGLTVLAGLARQGSLDLGNAGILAPLASTAASVAVYLVSTALVLAIFSVMYRLVPAVPTSFRTVWPGALAAAIGFEALQFGFSFYVAHFAHYNKVYGSLGAVVAFLFFVYLASMIFLFGAEVASEYPRLPPATATQPPAPVDEGKP